MLILLLLSMLSLAFNIQPIKASGTIYIRADGSIEPSTANIISTDNVTYYFTDNNYDEIVIERDNILVDGAGYTLQGTGSGNGVYLSGRTNITIKNMEIRLFYYGVYIYRSSSNCISGNNITTNKEHGIELKESSNNLIADCMLYDNFKYGAYIYKSNNNTFIENSVYRSRFQGIRIEYSFNNTVISNHIHQNNAHGLGLGLSSGTIIGDNSIHSNNMFGIEFDSSSNNIVYENDISLNDYGAIELECSSKNLIINNHITNNRYGLLSIFSSNNNLVYHNTIINNTQQACIDTSSYANFWDDSYPSGGNYWSDYNGTDLYSGPYQNETGSDGIGDSSYIIDSNNRDRYPLIHPYGYVSSSDLNSDGKVDIKDIGVAAKAFGSYPGHPKWNPQADLNGDDRVDIKDLLIIAKNFGKIYS